MHVRAALALARSEALEEIAAHLASIATQEKATTSLARLRRDGLAVSCYQAATGCPHAIAVAAVRAEQAGVVNAVALALTDIRAGSDVDNGRLTAGPTADAFHALARTLTAA